MIRAIAFDAYGTIFDVHSVAVRADALFPGRGAEFSALWRTKQIDYTRLRTLSDRYAPFSQVTRDALAWAAASLGLPLDDAAAETLMTEYDGIYDEPVTLTPSDASFDVRELFGELHAPVVKDRPFAHLLSVDRVGRFKTAPDAYALGPQALGVPAHEILFVSSNCWDACGATWYGYTTFWIDRAAAPVERLGVVPTATDATMRDVPAFVNTHNAAPSGTVAG